MASDTAIEALVGRCHRGSGADALLPSDDDDGTPDLVCDGLGCGGVSARLTITAILDALPDLLREDSAAGEALRKRLGLWLVRDSRDGIRLTGRWEIRP